MKNPFAKKTVNSVIASFQRTVADLRKIDEDKRAECSRINDTIAALQGSRFSAANEADRARAIADKIEKLVS